MLPLPLLLTLPTFLLANHYLYCHSTAKHTHADLPLEFQRCSSLQITGLFHLCVSTERNRRSGRQYSMSTRRMVALYDYDPRESSPNIDVEVPTPQDIGFGFVCRPQNVLQRLCFIVFIWGKSNMAEHL